MKGHVLVVEDNLANQELLCDWLESEGYRVSVASTLSEAFASFVDPLPQIVLLDVQLGSEDGLFLAGWLRERPQFKGIPVIAVTAHAMLTDQARMQDAGCDACVSKPIEFKGLAAHLDHWLARHAKV
jgi:two-component system cell cycle response regulator DivK